jgi:uncharacterized protein (TIGR02145 family)
MKTKILLFAAATFLTIQVFAQTVTDIDGNVYNTVTIGTQTWLKENLKTTRFQNGDTIPNIISWPQWADMSTSAYCYFNDDTNNANIYGNLYNWYTIEDSRQLCPIGWHVPQVIEWTTLIDYLGGDSVAGGQMKDTGILYWINPNSGANNNSEFSALPGGERDEQGICLKIGTHAYFWSATGMHIFNSFSYRLDYYSANIFAGDDSKVIGMSVRCIKDSTSSIKELNFNHEINIYPNPATDKIIIDKVNRQKLHITIYNLIGDIVLKREIDDNTVIDISFLTNGVYLIKVISIDKTVQKKIIKE